MNPEFRTISFDTNRIIKSIHHISEVSNVVTAIYGATKNHNHVYIDALETDGLGFVFPDNAGNNIVSSQGISNWIFRKAFEDFIIGLTQSLIEIYVFLEIYDLAKKSETAPLNPQLTVDGLQTSFSKKANKLPFPVLQTEIERLLNIPLAYKEEIATINQVRNCLVHRNARVDDSKPLTLRYIDLRIDVRVNGEIVEVTKEFKKKRTLVEEMGVQKIIKTLIFDRGSKVVMTPDIFKGVTYTCILFIHELVRNLPIDENIKTKLAPHFQIKVVTG
jgi:hypothetical protein